MVKEKVQFIKEIGAFFFNFFPSNYREAFQKMLSVIPGLLVL